MTKKQPRPSTSDLDKEEPEKKNPMRWIWVAVMLILIGSMTTSVDVNFLDVVTLVFAVAIILAVIGTILFTLRKAGLV